MNRLQEIETRLAAIAAEAETATGDALTKLTEEVETLKAERVKLEKEIETRQQLRNMVASGAAPSTPVPGTKAITDAEKRANEFAKTSRMTLGCEETRATLISGGTLATPTGVSGINDIPGAKYSSIVDMVKVVNCVGMSSNKVAYLSADIDAAATQTEGSAATEDDATFGYVTITPTLAAVYSQISEQAKTQSPLIYAAKVRDQAFVSLKKKAAAIIVAAMKASSLKATVTADLSSGSGVIGETTLRDLVLAYGGDESIVGQAVLFLNKTDLLAFGDVRGTNELKAIYEITPDTMNPNTGIIKEGGLSVKYCIVSGLTACSGTAQTASAQPTMFYGVPQAFELDLFSDYRIRVSADYAITSLMDTIVGDVSVGGDIVVKNGFAALTIASNA